MKVGTSTASLFSIYNTEEALEFLSKAKVPCAEVFLESYCEYQPSFADVLNEYKGDIDIHSVHTLTTQFEPQLYSINQRAQKDSFEFLDKAMTVAEKIGAKYYTFHGGARFKKTPIKIDFDRVGKITNDIVETCSKHKITLAYENVHWGYYNYIGFFSELKKRVPSLKGTLDVKQARQSGLSHNDFLREMGNDIVTVHLSDVKENGEMCLPGKGTIDFVDLFKRLGDTNFNGALLLEAYRKDYGEKEELFEALDYVKNLAKKYISK